MQTTADAITKPPGVIDSLQRGFLLINRHLWLLLIPLFVDVLVWRSPRFSLAHLIERAINLLFERPDLPAELAANSATYIEPVRRLGAAFNLLSFLGGTITGMPSFMARADSSLALTSPVPTVMLESVQQILLYTVVLIPIGLIFGSIWLALMAKLIKPETIDWQHAVRRAGWIWLNTGLYLLILIVAVVSAAGLFSLFAAMFMAIAGIGGLSIMGFVQIIFAFGLVWLGVGLTFVVSAISLDGVNVARAIWRSINVVGRNVTSTLGLLLLMLVITEGFAQIWLRLSSFNWGVIVGILGNSYLGTALMAATFLFYQGRYQHWQQVRKSVASARQQGADETASR